MSRWKTYVNETLNRMPLSGAGVYVVLQAGYPLYVGQSTRVRSRIEQHRFKWLGGKLTKTPWGPLPLVTIKIRLSTKFGEELMREARLIKRLRPERNVTGVVYPRSRSWHNKNLVRRKPMRSLELSDVWGTDGK